jgi:flagellar assembly protein FliH
MSSSKPGGPRQVPPPPNSRSGTVYTRFIPREELQGFANWTPDAFGGLGGGPAPASSAATDAAPEPNAGEWKAVADAARLAGYQDGYRDGLSALESFKQSFARQMSSQFAPLLHSFDSQLGALEQRIAAGVAEVATRLARQVVRSELAARPELVAAVATQAVDAVLLSARHIRVHVNPEDLALVEAGAAEALAARGGRLIADAALSRGGVRVESDMGRIDASIEARWTQAAEQIGQPLGLDQ